MNPQGLSHVLPNTFTPVTRPRLARRAMTLATALALLGGCAIEDELEPELEDQAPLEIEREGQVFERLDPVLEEEVEPGPDAVIRPLAALPEEPAEPRPLSDLTREELADQLRPVIATGGYTYLAQEPAWDAADAVLAGPGEPRGLDVLVRDGEGRPTTERVDEQAFRAIIGGDGRGMVGNTTVAPHNSIVQLQLYSGNTYRGWCSGSYIGPWTLITSAHCLVFSDTDRINRIVFVPARNGNSTPYGSFDCRLDDASGNNNYTWSVPNGYYYGQNESLDYAVLDTFPCHGAPNWFSGYAVNTGETNYSTYGYPADTCPGAPGPGNYQCGMSGSAYLNEWRIETHDIDAISGQSGSPWYVLTDTYRPAGVLWGYREYFDFGRCGFDVCRRNFARRIDNAFSDFIVSVAWDY
jgi:V8-like Glu-specific endopeptidase